MKVKGKQIKDNAFGIECHILILSLVTHNEKKSTFVKKVSVIKFYSNQLLSKRGVNISRL